MNETFLITGGCGFVGSNIAIKLKKQFQNCRIIAFDNLKRRGSELNLPRLKEFGIEFIHGDIRNKEDFDAIEGAISVIIEAAAEPSILSGIQSTPDYLLNTNLQGAINCLNFAVKHNAKFIFLSTSRVYPINNLNKIAFTEKENRFEINPQQSINGLSIEGISEDFPLNGVRSFYGTSKLCSEFLIQEYMEFYGLKAIINRCGVITGPWQMGKIDQGVVVLWLAKHYWKSELAYIGYGGEGKQVRDIIHIDDLYDCICMQLLNFELYDKEIFNVGGGKDVSVSLKELTQLCEEITGNKIKINSIQENRVADVPIYITDNSKITNLSSWRPKRNAKMILNDTFEWMKQNESILENLLK